MDLDDLNSLLGGEESIQSAKAVPKKLGLKPKLKPKAKPKPKTVAQPQPQPQQDNLLDSKQKIQQTQINLDLTQNKQIENQSQGGNVEINEQLKKNSNEPVALAETGQFQEKNTNIPGSSQNFLQQRKQSMQQQNQNLSQLSSDHGQQPDQAQELDYNYSNNNNLVQQQQGISNDNNTLPQSQQNEEILVTDQQKQPAKKTPKDPAKKVSFKDNDKKRKKRVGFTDVLDDDQNADREDVSDEAIEAGEKRQKTKDKRIATLISNREARKKLREEDNAQLLNKDVAFLTIRQLIKRAKLIEQQEKMDQPSTQQNDSSQNNLLEQQRSKNQQQQQQKQQQQQMCSQGPQLKFVDGQLVLDEESLQVEAQAVDDFSQYQRVRGEDQLLNSHTYMIRDKSQRWTKADDQKFFEFLGKVGANFDLMKFTFQTRTRNQLMSKYRREWKKNPAKMNEIMSQQGKHKSDTHFQKLVDVLVRENDYVPQLGSSSEQHAQNAENAEGEQQQQQQQNGDQNQQTPGQVNNNEDEGDDTQYQFNFGDNDGDDDQFDMDFD